MSRDSHQKILSVVDHCWMREVSDHHQAYADKREGNQGCVLFAHLIARDERANSQRMSMFIKVRIPRTGQDAFAQED
jgi:hypothetical protein